MDKFDIKQHCEEVYTINLEAVNMEERVYNTVQDLISDYALTVGIMMKDTTVPIEFKPTMYLDDAFDIVEPLPYNLCVEFLQYFGYKEEEIAEWAQGIVFEL